MLKNPFNWDGTQLKLDKHQPFAHYDRRTYWQISQNGYSTICQVKKVKNFLPCIFDEVKEFFNLFKTGTHWMRASSNGYLFIRVPIVDNQVVYEYDLSNFSIINDNYLQQIHDYYGFRELLGISQSNDRSFRLRYEQPIEPYFISYDENNFSGDNNLSVLSDNTRRRWFSKYSIEDTIHQLTSIYCEDDIQKYEYDFMLYLGRTIKRVDRDLCGYNTLIWERLKNVLFNSFT